MMIAHTLFLLIRHAAITPLPKARQPAASRHMIFFSHTFTGSASQDYFHTLPEHTFRSFNNMSRHVLPMRHAILPMLRYAYAAFRR